VFFGIDHHQYFHLFQFFAIVNGETVIPLWKGHVIVHCESVTMSVPEKETPFRLNFRIWVPCVNALSETIPTAGEGFAEPKQGIIRADCISQV